MIKIPKTNMHKWRSNRWDIISGYLGNGCVLAGGALRTSIKPNDTLSDYDLFFLSKDKLVETINRFKKDGWEPAFICPNKELYTYKYKDYKVQLIAKLIYNSVEELLASFDFTICQAAFDGEFFYYDKRMIISLKTNTIELNQITYPVATISRLFKYKQKSYKVKATTIRDIVKQISERSFTKEQMELYID